MMFKVEVDKVLADTFVDSNVEGPGERTSKLTTSLFDFTLQVQYFHTNPPRKKLNENHIHSRAATSSSIKMFGILKFQTFLLVVLLFICSCTYLHGVLPTWLDRNKSGYDSSFFVFSSVYWSWKPYANGRQQAIGNILARGTYRRAIEPVRESVLHSYGGK